jgi:hypothetical protein
MKVKEKDHMKYLSMLSIMAVMASILVLAGSADAACSSCSKEADWSETASAFLEGRTMSDEPVAFGPKLARAESSQFERRTDGSPATAENASDPVSANIALQSINAAPAVINSTATTSKITVAFDINSSERTNQGEMQLSANAQIKNSAGGEVAKLPLIRQSAGLYSTNWTADVPLGVYSIDIAAFSLDRAASFKDALQIEVLD